MSSFVFFFYQPTDHLILLISLKISLKIALKIAYKTKIIPRRWSEESYYNSALGRFKIQFEKDSDLIAPSETEDTEL